MREAVVPVPAFELKFFLLTLSECDLFLMLCMCRRKDGVLLRFLVENYEGENGESSTKREAGE